MGNTICCLVPACFFGQCWDHNIVDPDVDIPDDYGEDDLANQNYDEIKAKYIIPTD